MIQHCGAVLLYILNYLLSSVVAVVAVVAVVVVVAAAVAAAAAARVTASIHAIRDVSGPSIVPQTCLPIRTYQESSHREKNVVLVVDVHMFGVQHFLNISNNWKRFAKKTCPFTDAFGCRNPEPALWIPGWSPGIRGNFFVCSSGRAVSMPSGWLSGLTQPLVGFA